MVLTLYGVVAAGVLIITAYVSWHCGEEYGRDVGYSKGFDEAYKIHEAHQRGTKAPWN